MQLVHVYVSLFLSHVFIFMDYKTVSWRDDHMAATIY